MKKDWEQYTKIELEQIKKSFLAVSFVFPLLFGFLFPFLLSRVYPRWPWFISWICASIVLLKPSLLRFPYAVWMLFASIAGRLSTMVLLFLLFYLIITPVAVIMRLAGRDPMQRTYDKKGLSYRVAKPFNSSMEDLF
ncbi:MAG: hypothetical protein HYY51_00880 [Candidatus Magasanikbacteria bacterium]|nr:hypothetical protein [Candidatus Magasanikbacteria bacterium]